MGDHQWDDGEARELVIAIVCVYKSLLGRAGVMPFPVTKKAGRVLEGASRNVSGLIRHREAINRSASFSSQAGEAHGTLL